MFVSKLLIAAITGVVVTILVSSIYFQSSPLLWFVNTSAVYMFLRSGIVLMLLGLLLTNPPRSKLLRASLGGFAIVLIVVALSQIMAFEIYFVDAIIFTEVAIILGIEALEGSKVDSSKGYVTGG